MLKKNWQHTSGMDEKSETVSILYPLNLSEDQRGKVYLSRYCFPNTCFRNLAFQTAVTLAVYSAYKKTDSTKGKSVPAAGRWIKLEREHLEDVVNMSNNFKEYINQTWDENPSTKAKHEKIRDDMHGMVEQKYSRAGFSQGQRGNE